MFCKKVNDKCSNLGFGKKGSLVLLTTNILPTTKIRFYSFKLQISLKRAQGEPKNDNDSDIEDARNSFGERSKKAKKKDRPVSRAGELLCRILKPIYLYN